MTQLSYDTVSTVDTDATIPPTASAVATPEVVQTTHVAEPTRRSLLKAAGLVIAGTTPFFGPWAHNRVWAQAAQAKPLVIGLTMDASGQ